MLSHNWKHFSTNSLAQIKKTKQQWFEESIDQNNLKKKKKKETFILFTTRSFVSKAITTCLTNKFYLL